MARLRRDLRESEPPDSGENPEQRFRDLSRLLMACEPDTPAAVISDSIREKAAQLSASKKSAGAKLAALEKHIAKLGAADVADRHLDRCERLRQRVKGARR